MRAASRSVLHLLVLVSALAAGCEKTGAGLSAGSGSASGSAKVGSASGSAAGSARPASAPAQDIDSKDILARTELSTEVTVKHVLIAWSDLAGVYRGHMDPRASKRSNADAAALAQEVFAKMKADPDAIDALIKQYSEDPGSLSGEPYTVTAASRFVPEFKTLALRLKEKEAGIVKTQFGYHVMERVLPPPPDPLESSDIMARPPEAGDVLVQHILIGWKDVPAAKQALDPRAAQRSKADADKLAKDLLDKVRAGGDMAALMKQYSEDPGSKDNAQAYPVSADAQLVEPFKRLSLRLKMGEAGMVISPFGWHVIKRVPPPPPPPPPPPDSLDSVDILKRDPVTKKAKVKHILLGWTEAHAGDPRGAARDRKTLEALVKKTVAQIQKGAKIEPLMTELSEDPGSAKTGESYDVAPDAQLVEPFKNLSLRLKVGEVGVVKSQFGIHIIQRVE